MPPNRLELPAGLIFKNVGKLGGASLEHVHTQLIALPFVPDVLEQELAGAAHWDSQHGKCLFCEILGEELTHRRRLVEENDRFVAFCAQAGRQPYELWIVPRQHAGRFTDMARGTRPRWRKFCRQCSAGWLAS